MAEGVNKLTEEQLFDCLKSLNVPARLSDIRTPTKEFMTRVLECFLKDLQIDILNHNLRPFSATRHIEHPEIIEEGQTLTLLVMFLNIITSADSLDICARDIISPKPKRTKKILNYMIVFWKYFVLKYANFQAIAEKLQEEKKEADDIAEENEQLEAKYNECLAILKDELPNKEELISSNASKKEKCQELEKQREILTEENNASKKKENDLVTRISTTDVEIALITEQIKELDELILTSPEKMSNEIQKLKDEISEVDSKISKKEKKLKEKKKSIETLEQILESSSKDLDEVKNINKALQNFEDVVKSFILSFQKCLEEKENLEKLESELHIKEQLQAMNKHKFEKIHLQYKKQKESFHDTFLKLQSNLAQEQDKLNRVKVDNLELDKEMDKEVKSFLEIVEKCKEAEKTTLKLQKDFKSQKESIIKTFEADCAEIKSMIMKKYAV